MVMLKKIKRVKNQSKKKIRHTSRRYKTKVLKKADIYEKRYRNHPKIVPILAAAILFVAAMILVIALRDSAIVVKKLDSKIVILTEGNETKTLPTREVTVGDFIKKVGITLNKDDIVEPTEDTLIEEDDFRINIYRSVPVTIEDRGKTIETFSAAQTPRGIAKQAGIKTFPEDEVIATVPDDFLSQGVGHRIIIKRSTLVNLNLYGTPLPIRTQAKTVGELLESKGIEIRSGDQVRPSIETKLSDKIQVFITTSGKKLITEEQVIGAPTEYIDDNKLSFGVTVLRQAGADGKRSLTYEVDSSGRRKLIQNVVIVEPLKRIVARGKAISIPTDKSAAMSAAGISSGDQAYVNFIISRESGWNVLSKNVSSGAYGLCQALPGSKMASAGSDWETNAVTQLRWCTSYAVGRYGSWKAAYEFWSQHHWW